jgi:hypothetical protein
MEILPTVCTSDTGRGEEKMVSVLGAVKDKIVAAYRTMDLVMRGKAVETIEYELEELDNIFAILVLGSFIGIPSPPIHVTMELLPIMEKEFNIMLEKVTTAHDPLGDLFSILDID